MNIRADLKKTLVILAVFVVISIMTASEQFVPSGHAVDVMDVIRSSHHAIIIESPKNGSIYKDKEQMPLNFTVEYVYQEEYIAWQILNRLFYSFDGGPTKTIKVISGPTPIPYRFSTLLDISNLSNGLHKIEVTASFVVNINNLFVSTYNFSSTPISFSVFRDQAPNISIISPENKTYTITDVPLNFTVSELARWIGYCLDGQTNITITGKTTLTGLSDGMHSLTIYANDTVGRFGTSGTIYFTLDTISPSISLLSPENKTYGTTDIPLTFTVTETASWIGYNLDAQGNATITGNTTLTELSHGSHNLTVYAKDTAGNTGASETIYFSIAQKEPFPTWIAATTVIVAIALVGAAVLIYFTKVKKTTGKAEK